MEFGQIHHIEYYVKDLKKSNIFWDWFLSFMNYTKSSEWEEGVSWEHKNGTYIVFVKIEAEFLKRENTRQGNGLNHIAFMGGSLSQLDEIQEILISKEIKILKEMATTCVLKILTILQLRYMLRNKIINILTEIKKPSIIKALAIL